MVCQSTHNVVAGQDGSHEGTDGTHVDEKPPACIGVRGRVERGGRSGRSRHSRGTRREGRSRRIRRGRCGRRSKGARLPKKDAVRGNSGLVHKKELGCAREASGRRGSRGQPAQCKRGQARGVGANGTVVVVVTMVVVVTVAVVVTIIVERPLGFPNPPNESQKLPKWTPDHPKIDQKSVII